MTTNTNSDAFTRLLDDLLWLHARGSEANDRLQGAVDAMIAEYTANGDQYSDGSPTGEEYDPVWDDPQEKAAGKAAPDRAAPGKESAAKKTAVKKTAAKKTAATKAVVKKTTAEKTATKETTAEKTTGKVKISKD